MSGYKPLTEKQWAELQTEAGDSMPSRIRCDYPDANGRKCILDCGHPEQGAAHLYEVVHGARSSWSSP